MEKRCMICDEVIDEDYGKLRGTLLKVREIGRASCRERV